MNTLAPQVEVEVKSLMQGNKNIILLHAEKRYSLTITRRGKLILTAADEVASNDVSPKTNHAAHSISMSEIKRKMGLC